eukprot:scaffold273665_cov18-Tisochrysis_lutea.AAC.1
MSPCFRFQNREAIGYTGHRSRRPPVRKTHCWNVHGKGVYITPLLNRMEHVVNPCFSEQLEAQSGKCCG